MKMKFKNIILCKFWHKIPKQIYIFFWFLMNNIFCSFFFKTLLNKYHIVINCKILNVILASLKFILFLICIALLVIALAAHKECSRRLLMRREAPLEVLINTRGNIVTLSFLVIISCKANRSIADKFRFRIQIRHLHILLGSSRIVAEHFKAEFTASMKKFGIEMDYRHQGSMYRSGAYTQAIIESLRKREEIFEILDSFKTKDKSLSEEELKKQHDEEKAKDYPVSIFCPECHTDFTTITNLSDDCTEADYTCRCGYHGHINFTENFNCKLGWKIDWPMRWRYEQVDFEPGGKDHAAPTGSYSNSKIISKKIFDFDPPLFQGYEFIGIKGETGKIRKVLSPGLNTTANALLKRYFPDIEEVEQRLFSEIAEAVERGEADAGVLIHEGRFVYERRNLELVADLGKLWEAETNLPLPLGAIIVKREIDENIISKFDKLLSKSVCFAFENPLLSRDFVKQHAQELEDDVIEKHIALFVNDYTISLGEEGREAVKRLLNTPNL